MAVFAVGIPLSARAVVLHTPTTPEELAEKTTIAGLVKKVAALREEQSRMLNQINDMIVKMPDDPQGKVATIRTASGLLMGYLDKEQKKAKAADEAIQRTILFYGIDPGGTTA